MLNVVVIGGGFGGLKFLQRARSSKIQFTLIDKQNHHLFQPLLYQVATAVLSPANIAFPIRRMFKNFKNVKVILDEATDINREDKTVTISSGEKIKYDQLVVRARMNFCKKNFFTFSFRKVIKIFQLVKSWEIIASMNNNTL